VRKLELINGLRALPSLWLSYRSCQPQKRFVVSASHRHIDMSWN